jgi:hypothetical protein
MYLICSSGPFLLMPTKNDSVNTGTSGAVNFPNHFLMQEVLKGLT